MDAEKLLDELAGTELGGLLQERWIREILEDLRREPTWHPDDSEETRSAHREWLREVADYLEENYS